MFGTFRISFLKLTVLHLMTTAGILSRCHQETLNMCQCTEHVVASEYIVDCSNAAIAAIPLGIPAKTTHLYLDHNNLTKINNFVFTKQNQGLKFLSLTHNQLNKLENEVFKYLFNLEVLILYNNKLEYVTSMPKNVFLPLRKSLKVLDIRRNLLNPDLKLMNYPVSLSELHTLVELRMDILRDKPLPKEYRDMEHLPRLIFTDGRPNVVSLKDDTLDSVSKSNISEIYLIGLNVGVIAPRTFSKLPQLRILDLSNNPQLDAHLGEIGPSLRNTSIEVLRLNNTGISNEGDPSLISTKLEHFCGLPLKELTLDSNYLHDFKHFLHKCFPLLEILSLGDNYIMTYNIMRSDIIKLRHLVGFNVSFQRRIADFTHSDMDGWSTAMHENKYITKKLKEQKGMVIFARKAWLVPIDFRRNWSGLTFHTTEL